MARKRKKNTFLKGKKKVKLSLFADYMLLHIKNPKKSTRKLLKLINELSKFAEYKSIYKNQLHVYILAMNNIIYNSIQKEYNLKNEFNKNRICPH